MNFYEDKILEGNTGEKIKMLDVGCGKPIISAGFMARHDYYGIDILQQDNPYAKQLLMQSLEGKKLPFSDNMFDFILMKDILEHIRDTRLLMTEVCRVLKKGGRILIKTPDEKSCNAWSDWEHIRPYNKKSLTKLCKDFNLEILTMKKWDSFWRKERAISWVVEARKITVKKKDSLFDPFKLYGDI